jgi:hypothetical protein
MLMRKMLWVLLAFWAMAYFAPLHALAECSCTDIIPVFGICNGDECTNIEYSVCSSDSFTSCFTCVPANRLVACCDDEEFFRSVKPGGPCLNAGIIRRPKTTYAYSSTPAKSNPPKKQKIFVLVLPTCDRGYVKVRVG